MTASDDNLVPRDIHAPCLLPPAWKLPLLSRLMGSFLSSTHSFPYATLGVNYHSFAYMSNQQGILKFTRSSGTWGIIYPSLFRRHMPLIKVPYCFSMQLRMYIIWCSNSWCTHLFMSCIFLYVFTNILSYLSYSCPQQYQQSIIWCILPLID